MDRNWFERRKKVLGVTNSDIARRMGRNASAVTRVLQGATRLSIDWAEAFAEVLQVDLATVLAKIGGEPEVRTRHLAPGFAESDAAPFLTGSAESRTDEQIAQLMGARAGVDVWEVRSQALVLAGYLPGDRMLVDTHLAERAKPDDIVIAQVYSQAGAVTVLRRYVPPVLMPAAPVGARELPHIVDGNNVLIRGVVTWSWRKAG